jgi:hypothetical protein
MKSMASCKHYSGARNSRIGCRQRRFMQTANNHFGIKCHAGWTKCKAYMTMQDRNVLESTPKHESFKDHALFWQVEVGMLLFELKRWLCAWAKGSKSRICYRSEISRKLISYIERIIWDSLTHKFWGIITSLLKIKKLEQWSLVLFMMT